MARNRLLQIVIVSMYVVALCLAQVFIPLTTLVPKIAAAPGDTAKLEILLAVSPDVDGGRFDVKLDGTKIGTALGNGNTTGTQIVAGATSHVILEQASSSATTLSNYTTVVSCKDQNGTGVTLGSSNPTGSTTRQLTVTTPTNSDAVCVFTNTHQMGTITVTNQVINDNGGSAGANDFGIMLGTNVLTSGQTFTIPADRYSFNESGVPGYAVTSITGTNCPAQFGTILIISKGQDISCAVVHDDLPAQVRTLMSVTNTAGGHAVTSDFAPTINGEPQTLGQYAAVNAGNVVVGETAVDGYQQTSTNCIDDNSNQTLPEPVTVGLGQSITCTISNQDIAPSVLVINSVTNDNGGTATVGDFMVNVSPSGQDPYLFSSSLGESAPMLQAGDYSIREVGLAGYAASYSPDCSGTIGLGQQRTCVISNDDIAPLLKITNIVVNDNGGSLQAADFPLTVGETSVLSDTVNPFDEGFYLVSGVPQPGYLASTWSGDCAPDGSITLHIGGSYNCTITNDDAPAIVTLSPTIVNDNDGRQVIQNFVAKIDGRVVNWSAPIVLGPGQHTIATDAPAGYRTSPWAGDCAASGNFELQFGQQATCAISFDDIAPNLSAVVQVVNTNGGMLTPSGVTLAIDGRAMQDGDSADFDAGSYTVTLPAEPGYTAMFSGDWAADGTIDLAIGSTYHCTATLHDQPATLHVKHIVINDNGGQKTQADFGYSVNGGAVQNFDTTDEASTTIPAGHYTVVGHDPLGYSTTYDNCAGLVITIGQTVTCTITSDDIAPSLTLINQANPASDQPAAFDSLELGNFTLASDDTMNGIRTFSNLLAGVYVVRETPFDSWNTPIISCDTSDYSADGSTATITLALGTNVSCTFVNTPKQLSPVGTERAQAPDTKIPVSDEGLPTSSTVETAGAHVSSTTKQQVVLADTTSKTNQNSKQTTNSLLQIGTEIIAAIVCGTTVIAILRKRRQ